MVLSVKIYRHLLSCRNRGIYKANGSNGCFLRSLKRMIGKDGLANKRDLEVSDFSDEIKSYKGYKDGSTSAPS